MGRVYADDFETITTEPTRVWCWASANVDRCEIESRGLDIKSYLAYAEVKGGIHYFRNLKFDGEFLLLEYLRQGYIQTQDRKPKPGEFYSVISDDGKWYSVKVKTRSGKNIEYRDSLKLIPMSIQATAKAFGLEITKGEIDYHADRPMGYRPTPEEWDYVERDVLIDAKALQYFQQGGYTKLTIGSNAMHVYGEMISGTKIFEKMFPPLIPEIDEEIRRTYKGGFVYVNPLYREHEVGAGIVCDINSHFPARMKYEVLPYGQPRPFAGEPRPNSIWPCYTIHIKCMFWLKEGKIPSIQLKHNIYCADNEYLEDSKGEIMDLWLTRIDYELFCEQYDIEHLQFCGGYYFHGKVNDTFAEYIDFFMHMKEEATISGNKGMRTIAKLFLNNLYGKFGTSPNKGKKLISYDNIHDKIIYTRVEEDGPTIYVPVATYITSAARAFTIRSCQKVRDYSLLKYGFDAFLYSDTDSLHTLLPEEDIRQLLDCHETRLGAWDIEAHFTRAKYLRQKCYIEEVEVDGEKHIAVTVAGLPKNMHDLVTFDNFKVGVKYSKPDGKKRFKHVSGGVILIDVDFQIKDRKPVRYITDS